METDLLLSTIPRTLRWQPFSFSIGYSLFEYQMHPASLTGFKDPNVVNPIKQSEIN